MSFTKALVKKWREVVIGAIVLSSLGYLSSLWSEVVANYQLATIPLVDVNEILTMARNTDVGHDLLYVTPYYDLISGQQYLAVAYKFNYHVLVKGYKVINSIAIPISKPIPLGDGFLSDYDFIKPGVHFSQKNWFTTTTDIDPVISEETNDVEGKSKKEIEEDVKFKRKVSTYIKLLYGFTDSNKDNGLEIYSTYIDRSTAGVGVRIFLSDFKKNDVYQIRHEILRTGEGMHPLLSTNLKDDETKSWLYKKLDDTIMNGATPLDQVDDDELVESTNTSDEETKDDNQELLNGISPETQWFNENGRNATAGNIVPIEILEHDEYKYSESGCVIDGVDEIYFTQFKNGIMGYNKKDHKTYVVYMPDPENFREPQGMIEGKDYIWFGILIYGTSGGFGSAENVRVLAMKKQKWDSS